MQRNPTRSFGELNDATTCNLVPIQQAEIVIEKLKTNNVPCELVVRKGQGHGWPEIGNDFTILADWFDKYLSKSPEKK